MKPFYARSSIHSFVFLVHCRFAFQSLLLLWWSAPTWNEIDLEDPPFLCSVRCWNKLPIRTRYFCCIAESYFRPEQVCGIIAYPLHASGGQESIQLTTKISSGHKVTRSQQSSAGIWTPSTATLLFLECDCVLWAAADINRWMGFLNINISIYARNVFVQRSLNRKQKKGR